MKYDSRSGFSLVELSIVLVILGLLVGGILGGQALIHAAELRSVTNDMERYQTAINTFRSKYNAIPGDMNNATRFWPAAATPPSSCVTTENAQGASCDGNGDGMIGSAYSGDPYGSERYQIWKHLSNAGLIDGTYTGIYSGTIGHRCVAGINCPRSKISNAVFRIGYLGEIAPSHAGLFEGFYGNQIIVEESATASAVLTPEDQWNIDTKVDDGMPGKGMIRGYKASYLANCAVGDTVDTTYDLQYTSQACRMIRIRYF